MTDNIRPQSMEQSAPDAPVTAEMAGQVFISYASQDLVVAEKICAGLEVANLPCWIAPRNVRTGDSYAAAIVQAINSCRMLVLILSKNAIASGHVLREVERASSKKRPVLPVRMDVAELPPEFEYFLSANQWLDATVGPIEQILPALVEAVRGRSPGPVPHRAPPASLGAPVFRRRLGELALVAAVIGIGYLLANRFWWSQHALANKSRAPSIAVLPFSDLSGESNQGYFSEGIAEEILNVLAHVKGLHVASRTSSFQFRKSDLGAPAIGEKLGVRSILEGSVRKAGDTVRITAQLIDATTDQQLWSQTFDRPLSTANLFAIQDEIAKTIVDHLAATIGGATDVPAPARRKADTDDVDAYDMYLRGRALFIARSQQNLREAARMLESAVEKDSQFARAWETLAAVYTVSDSWNITDKPDYSKAALDAAATALRLDPHLSLAYAVRGDVQSRLLLNDAAVTWDDSIASLTQAVANDALDATAFAWRGQEFLELGYLHRAAADLNHCLGIDPAYEMCRRYLALTYLYLGDVQEGLRLYEMGLEKDYHSYDVLFAPAVVANGDRVGALSILAATYSGKPQLVRLHFRALTDPAFSDHDRRQALQLIGARWLRLMEGAEILRQLKAYDQMVALPLAEVPTIWWARDGPGWLSSPARKAMITQCRLPEYWRKHGFPPQCKPIGKADFECR